MFVIIAFRGEISRLIDTDAGEAGSSLASAHPG